jgi:hypothetical protein
MKKIILVIIVFLTVSLNVSAIDLKNQGNNFLFKQDINRAIIVSGGPGQYKTGYDPSEPVFDRTAKHAVEVFQNKGYSVEFYKRESYDVIEEAITSIGSSSKVFLFFIDHGTLGFFRKGMYLNHNGDIMHPSDLKRWVDTIDADSITIVLDMCHAGMFIPEVSGDGRIVIASTSTYGFAMGRPNIFEGESYFSKPFLDALEMGKTYGEAWEVSDEKVDNFFNHFNILLALVENPLIDDNGDGIGSGTNKVDYLSDLNDGELALQTYP